ncbi:MAG: hypothetical protein LAN83_13700 [Acidobacteriia bacterium]|nr:hypothetical protein [Terriglobia bacterium]
MTGTPELSELAAEWRKARLLYPLYAALAREFVIELPPCGDLEAEIDAPPQESVELARHWFLDMDNRIQVHQLRQFLQTTSLTSDEGLRTLLTHHLGKQQRSDSDRDKVDFLLVQFFSHSAPSRLEDADVDLDYVAQVLEPVLGTFDLSVPAWLNPLDEILQAANRCAKLNDLLSSGILEKGRKLKSGCGENYFQLTAMVAFTRFSFLMRRVFFRLLHQDLNAIVDGLRQLEQRGVHSLDCRRAQFSADEPTSRLRMICQSWKVMFHAEYSSGQPLRMLVDMRSVVDSALARTAKNAATKQPAAASPAPRAQAAAANANTAATAPEVIEFEVSSGSPDWGPDAPAGLKPGPDDGTA